jgi:hypothetical protein
MRRLVLPLAAAALLALAVFPATSRAASPSSGTLSLASPSLTWSNTLPMNGTAPAVTRISCNVPTTCDDYALTIDRGTDSNAYVTLSLVPSGSVAAEEIILYAPGCPIDPTQSCYQVVGTETHMTGPANGAYNVRVACTHCLAAGYTMTATMVAAAPPPNIPATFNQSFGWVVHAMPGVDDKGTPASATGEPGIWINKLDHVIVNTFGPTVWISQDAGRSFSFANQSIDIGCNSGDADGVVSVDDAYYADNLCLAGGTNLTYTSRDGGKTWQAGGQGLPSIAGAPDSDRQWYAPDPITAGRVYFAYHDLQGPNINVWRSDDYGQTFTQYAPVTLLGPTFVDASQGNTTSRPWVDPIDNNIVSMLYTYNDAQSSATTPPTAPEFNLREVGLARSTDAGKTWTNNLVWDAGSTDGNTNTIAHEFPQATMDSAGNLYVLLSEKIGGQSNTHIVMGVLPRGATTFSKVFQVDTGLQSNVFPWAIGGDPGMVDISWYGSPAADNNDHNAQWSEMFAQTTNALSANPTFVQSRVSGPQPMHTADICLAGTLCLVTGGNRNLADFQGVAVDHCGYADMVWTDDASGAATTMFARQTAGGSIHPTACGAKTTSGGPTGPTTTTPTTGAGAGPASGTPNTSAAEPRAALPAAGVVVVVAAAGLAGRCRRRRIR